MAESKDDKNNFIFEKDTEQQADKDDAAQASASSDSASEIKTDEAAGGETKKFVLGDGGKEPPDFAEDRGAVKDYSVGLFVWKALRPLLIFAVSAGLIIFFGVKAYHHVEESYFAPVDAGSTITKSVEVKPGSSLSTIASLLYEQGVIRNKFVFQMYVDVNDKSSKLLAGKYQLSPNMTMDEIVEALEKGGPARETVKITFTEGMTAEDIADTLLSKGIFDDTKKQTFCRCATILRRFRTITHFSKRLRTANRWKAGIICWRGICSRIRTSFM